MAKQPPKEINYQHINSLLNSKATKHLEEQVAEEINIPDGPLTVEQLLDMQRQANPDMVIGTHFDKKPAPSEQELRQKEILEMEQLDMLLGEDE
ncbi:hypothetical protein KAR91_42540 [Candidatus Pacearchaeota archaeon]|nr:hypothetical protein [Candidatus Pacearchaeota archaeon]